MPSTATAHASGRDSSLFEVATLSDYSVLQSRSYNNPPIVDHKIGTQQGNAKIGDCGVGSGVPRFYDRFVKQRLALCGRSAFRCDGSLGYHRNTQDAKNRVRFNSQESIATVIYRA